jgi:formate-dependent nitrite reductase membrane component NrfD
MAMERQTSWGWQVVADVFLGGIGAGLLLVSFLAEQTYGVTRLTSAGSIIGPSLVIVGILFLLLELGKPTNSPRAFINFGTSWMSRGVILQPALIVFGLLYALLPLGIEGFKTTVPGIIIGALAALLALLVALYHGLLFSQARDIDLWNNPLLPMLYFISALAGGTAILMLLSPFLAATASQLRMLAVVEIALICLVLISIWIMASVRPSTAYRESLERLFNFSFAAITLAIGCGVPLILLIISLFTSGMATYTALFAVCGALVLIGTYHLRHAITSAGYHYSLNLAF